MQPIEEKPIMEQPIEKFPRELLYEILKIVAAQAATTKQKKDHFKAMKSGVKLFFFSPATDEALFEDLNVFMTPASMGRLHAVSSHPLLKKAVRTITFHRPALQHHEDLWAEYAYGPNASSSKKRRQALGSYCRACLEEQLGLDSGRFTRQWTTAIAEFINLRSIGITGDYNEDNYMTARQAENPPEELKALPWYCTRTDVEMRDKPETMIARLYPTFYTPYAASSNSDYWFNPDLYPDLGSKMIERVMRAVVSAQIRLEHLRVGAYQNVKDTFDWSPFLPAFQHLRVAEIHVRDYDADCGHMVATMASIAPQLRGLRLYGQKMPDQENVDTEFKDLARFSDPSLTVLELHDFDVEHSIRMMIELLSAYPGLRYCRLHTYSSMGTLDQAMLAQLFRAMKAHPSLEDFDMFLEGWRVEFSTYPTACHDTRCANIRRCRVCRDMARVKLDVVQRVKWPKHPYACVDYEHEDPAVPHYCWGQKLTEAGAWAHRMKDIQYAIARSDSQAFEGDDDLSPAEYRASYGDEYYGEDLEDDIHWIVPTEEDDPDDEADRWDYEVAYMDEEHGLVWVDADDDGDEEYYGQEKAGDWQLAGQWLPKAEVGEDHLAGPCEEQNWSEETLEGDAGGESALHNNVDGE